MKKIYKIILLVKKTYPYVKPYMFYNVINFISSQISMLLTLVVPLLMKYLIDNIIIEGKWNDIPYFIILMMIISFASQVLNLTSGYIYAKFSETIYSDARNSLFKKLINKNIHFFKQVNDGDLISRLMEDSGYLHTMLSYILCEFLVNILKIIVVFSILFSMNTFFACIALLTVPVFLFLNKKYGKKLKEHIIYTRKCNSKLTGFYIDAFKNIKLIKNLNNEKIECLKSEEINKKMKKIQIKTEFTGYLMHSIMGIFTNINQLIILSMGSYAIYRGNLTVGGLIAFHSYLSHIYTPFLNITNAYAILNRTMVCVERFFEYDNNEYIEDFYSGEKYNICNGKISFNNVKFKYDNDLILNNVNFNISSKDKVLLTGKSGQGKSTIFNILKRFYPIDSGEVYIDNKNINNLNLEYLRKEIFYISQEREFFNISIRENFKRIDGNLSDEEIWSALAKAKIDELIKKPNYEGLDTIISRNAENFSGGEKQRLNLAKIFVQNKKIVILDEPFTGIDSATVKIIWENIKNCLNSTTVIFVDHNFEDKKYFNVIIKIEDGLTNQYNERSEKQNEG